MAKIVIVEGSPTQTLMTSRVIRAYGHEVICAIDGKDGLHKAFLHIPAVMILGVNLPDMDGFDVCRTLKNDLRTSNLIVIIHTARSGLSTLVSARQAGADYCVFKSDTSYDELVAHIQQELVKR